MTTPPGAATPTASDGPDPLAEMVAVQRLLAWYYRTTPERPAGT